MKYDIFLSHCKENKENTAFPLYQILNALGFCVWFDREKIHTGDSIYNSIESALYDSAIVVALIRDTYLERQWTQYELNLAIRIEQDESLGNLKRVFPIYQRLERQDVENIFFTLKDKAFESLTTDYFDISTTESRTILDRIVFFYFSNSISCPSVSSWEWLIPHKSRKYISQLIILLNACEHIEKDLRTCLISYTNAIRYLLAILNQLQSTKHSKNYYFIANRYCDDIANRCFSFHYEITYEMLLSCKKILSVLIGDLKILLNSI